MEIVIDFDRKASSYRIHKGEVLQYTRSIIHQSFSPKVSVLKCTKGTLFLLTMFNYVFYF